MLKNLPKENLKLNEVEERIIAARLNGMAFCQIHEKDLKTAMDQIIVRGAAMMGCDLPATEFFARLIADEVEQLIIQFGYSKYTLEEILLSMRLNINGGLRWPSGIEIEHIPFSGRTFNAAFLSKTLMNYKTLRTQLDRKLENFVDGY